MARMPGARWRPISRNYTRRVTTKDCILLHVTGAPNATSQHGWFNTRGANASSHFHVDLVGNIEQYIDSDHMSWANRDGNPRSITIETQGGANGEWTTAQVRAIRSIIQWIRQHHPNIPLRQMTSSFRSQKGIGWHRLGCNGNFPSNGILRGRNQRGGGELWSGAFGKVCPGDDRIRQVPAIIRQAGGHWTPATTEQANRQQARSWFDMATPAELRKIVKEEIRVASWAYRGKANKDAWAILREILSVVKNIRDNSKVRPWLYKGGKDDRDMHAVLKQTDRNVAAIKGTVDGLVEAVKQIDGVDPAEIGRVVNDGVSKALSSLEADVSLNINTSEETPTEEITE